MVHALVQLDMQSQQPDTVPICPIPLSVFLHHKEFNISTFGWEALVQCFINKGTACSILFYTWTLGQKPQRLELVGLPESEHWSLHLDLKFNTVLEMHAIT